MFHVSAQLVFWKNYLILGLFTVTLKESNSTFQWLCSHQGLVDFSCCSNLGGSVFSWNKFDCFILGLACLVVGLGKTYLPCFPIVFVKRNKAETSSVFLESQNLKPMWDGIPACAGRIGMRWALMFLPTQTSLGSWDSLWRCTRRWQSGIFWSHHSWVLIFVLDKKNFWNTFYCKGWRLMRPRAIT